MSGIYTLCCINSNVFIFNLMTLINWIWYIKPNAYFLLRSGRHGSGGDHPSTDKRAHHNALERKRRDHIKDSFSSLRDAIPTMQVSFDSDLLKFPNDQCVLITFQLISFLITLHISYFFRVINHLGLKFWKRLPITLHSCAEKINLTNK